VAYRLADLAEATGGRVEGDPEHLVEAIRALEAAGPHDLSFVTMARHRGRVLASRAGALLVGEDLAAELAAAPGQRRPLLVVEDTGFALARLLGVFQPEEARAPGAHATAIVEAGAAVDATAHLGPYVVIGAGSRVGAGAAVLAHAVVGRGCTLGERAVVHPHAVLYDRTEVGAGSIVHAGVVLGGDGFGYATTRDGVHHKVPQVGKVVLEEDVEVGPNTTIDRATLGETRVGAGTKIDNQVMLGHNVQIGRRSILCAQVGIAGSTSIGSGAVLGARVGAVDHIDIGDGVQAAAGTDLFHSLPPGAVVGGSPAHEIGRWRRQMVLVWKLEEMFRRLRALERRLHLRQRPGEAAAEAAEACPELPAAWDDPEGAPPAESATGSAGARQQAPPPHAARSKSGGRAARRETR
jgi:UDP-3-O-[3-hydroxymyristoyl] glucosamine N-acyltransferase